MLSMWPVENHYSAVQTKKQRVNFLFECSGFLFSAAPTPTTQRLNSSWKLLRTPSERVLCLLNRSSSEGVGPDVKEQYMTF